MKKLLLTLIMGITLVSLALATFNQQTPKPAAMIPIMNDDYSAEWYIIDSLERQGLPESALEKVEVLYKRASNDNNPPQVVKTVLYIGKYTIQLKEEGQVKGITFMESEMNKASFPVKSIFQSYLGQAYAQYLHQNRWRFRDRTSTAEPTGDFATWSPNQLVQKSRELVLASVADDKTKLVKTEDFNAILTNGKNAAQLRPTLYDILVHHAIDFFSNEQNNLTEPVYKFYINEAKAIGNNDEFLSYQPESKDTTSAKLKTIQLLQELTRHHQQEKNLPALIDVTLKRLSFVNNQGIIENKTELYKKSLSDLIQKYQENEMVTEIYHQLALQYFNEGNQQSSTQGRKGVRTGETPDMPPRKKARDLCMEAIKKFPDTYGAGLCQHLLNNIEGKALSQQVEIVNAPNQPILTSIQYTNVKKAWFKTILITDKLLEKLQDLRRDQQISVYNSMKPVQQWSQELPDPGDFIEHQVELKMEGLPFGRYVIMIASSPDFTMDGQAVGLTETYISNLGSWSRSTNDARGEVIVYHRASGHPIAGAEVTFDQKIYNRKEINYNSSVSTRITDADGKVETAQMNYGQLLYKIKYKDDYLDLSNRLYLRNRSNNNRAHYQTTYFTDRSIYRPGQTIYFKGIVIHKDVDNMPTIVPNEKTEVVFYNTNGQVVERVTLTTNEFGTFNGSFTAPESGLLGRMSIRNNNHNGGTIIRVEEYKRPKFEVEFDPVEKTYRLEEMVRLTGNAKAFAGNNIDGATVSYRVSRQARYPYWPWYWRGYSRYLPPGSNESMEIIHGFTETDENGQFTISFKAVPDPATDPEFKPEFTYTVTADVVDITGETRTGTTNVRVGYVALAVDLQLPEAIHHDSIKEIAIKTTNLSGVFAPAIGTLEIQRIMAPKTPLIKRFWQQPDQYILNEKVFKAAFPHYAYKDENEKANWPAAGQPITLKFKTEESPAVAVNKNRLSVGWYRVKLNTKDRYGTPIEMVKHFSVFDTNNKVPVKGSAFWHHLEKKSYEPGETAEVIFGNGYDGIKVFFEVIEDGEIVRRKWLDVNQLAKEKIAIEEKHRGNVSYSYAYAQHFRSTFDLQHILVPWSNKELSFEYISFRDKLKPGQKEEWQVKISGPKKEKLAAEMVATLYDASLDEFAMHGYYLNLFPNNNNYINWAMAGYGAAYSQLYERDWNAHVSNKSRVYPALKSFGFSLNGFYGVLAGDIVYRSKRRSSQHNLAMPAPQAEGEMMMDAAVEEVQVQAPQKNAPPPPRQESNDGSADLDQVKVRTNLNETVFFYPDLRTDEEGNILIKFTMNEALTRWKLLGMAHTKDLKYGITENTVVTQKELMVVPNAPRFVREGDQLFFTAKVNNLTEEPISGTARLELFDAISMQSVNAVFDNNKNTQNFSAPAGQSAPLRWKISIPFGKVAALTHRIVASAGKYADGEESTIPVVTNRMMVTEAKPLPVRGKSNKKFDFAALSKAGQSNTLSHHKLTLEFTSNPAWYAVQSLPYLMEYPYDCTEQIFNRFYANSLATSVANAHPKVKRVFEQWKGTDAMDSNLRKNEELKTALLEETPWVMTAQSEEQQRRNIGLLFDLNKMSREQTKAIAKLRQRQNSDGSFSWMPGGVSNRYITQNVIEGIGHLDRLGVKSIDSDPNLIIIKKQGLKYIDKAFLAEYTELKKQASENKHINLADNHLTAIQIHYLYCQSFFPKRKVAKEMQEAIDYYFGQAEKYWLKKNLYQQGMIALAMNRADKTLLPTKIIASLKERAIKNEEMGMYWKTENGYFWYQLPIETHALLIEAFAEVAKDEQAVDDMKVWLLKTKQTTHWKTTKATAAAVYALLSNGTNWLLEDQPVEIKIGKQQIDQSKLKKQAGTGYFKTSWDGAKITDKMGKIEVKNPNANVAWGAVYWQYFEDLDKITTFEETPLQLKKSLFKQTNGDRGPVLTPITTSSQLIPGDLIKVRIELRVDRPMEYVHMKDMRASGLEPVNVISSYKYQGGLGYYESTKDVSTNFFFSRLHKGVHVFEYPVRVFHAGDFSNGITTIQCMYAPEFTSHSEGIRIVVGE